MMTNQALVIRLNPFDDVVIACREIEAGTPLAEEARKHIKEAYRE